MTTLADFIEVVNRMYNLRNGGVGNPVLCSYTISGTKFVVVASVEEPSLRTLPLEVLWLCMDTEKNGQSVENETFTPSVYNAPQMYKRILRRRNLRRDAFVDANLNLLYKEAPDDNVVDGLGTENTWVFIGDYDNLFDVIQQYPYAHCPFLDGELSPLINIKPANNLKVGITKIATKIDANTMLSNLWDDENPIAVGDNDQRLTDARMPLPHFHTNLAAERIVTESGSISVSSEAPPLAVGGLLTVVSNAKIGWRPLNRQHVAMDYWTLDSIAIDSETNNGVRSVVNETDKTVQYKCKATYIEPDSAPRFVYPTEWKIYANRDDAVAQTSPGSPYATIDDSGLLTILPIVGTLDVNFVIRVNYTERKDASSSVTKSNILPVTVKNQTVLTNFKIVVDSTDNHTVMQPDGTLRIADSVKYNFVKYDDKTAIAGVNISPTLVARWLITCNVPTLNVTTFGDVITIADDAEVPTTTIIFNKRLGILRVVAVDDSISKIVVSISADMTQGMTIKNAAILTTVDNVATKITNCEVVSKFVNYEPTNGRSNTTVGNDEPPFNLYTNSQKQFFVKIHTVHPTGVKICTVAELRALRASKKLVVDWLHTSTLKLLEIDDDGLMTSPKIATVAGPSVPHYTGTKNAQLYVKWGVSKKESAKITFGIVNNPVQSITVSGDSSVSTNSSSQYVVTATLLNDFVPAIGQSHTKSITLTNVTWSIIAGNENYYASIDAKTGLLQTHVINTDFVQITIAAHYAGDGGHDDTFVVAITAF